LRHPLLTEANDLSAVSVQYSTERSTTQVTAARNAKRRKNKGCAMPNFKFTMLVFGLGLIFATNGGAQDNPYLSLKEVPRPLATAAIIPEVPGSTGSPIPGPKTNLDFRDLKAAGIVKDQDALVRLGKAFFWDMQVGSDGIQSCATCHFSAGADNRTRNQISPGLQDTNFKQVSAIAGDNSFGNSAVPFTANDPHTPAPPGPSQPAPTDVDVIGEPHFKPNAEVVAEDFPLNRWLRPTLRTPRGPHVDFLAEFLNVDRDTNDVISSQGVRHTLFTRVQPGSAVEQGTPAPDIYNLAKPGEMDIATRVRRAEARNAPTVINAVFNFDNFWDGRASFIFNGVNPFGFRDRTSTLKQTVDGKMRDVFVRITNSSLASQAVGPATSNFEMSFANRDFPDIAKKLLSLKPLAKQYVHPEDSVLGQISAAHISRGGRLEGQRGLRSVSYTDMIKDAFEEQWWGYSDYIEQDSNTVAKQQSSTNDVRTMIRSRGRGRVMEGIEAAKRNLGKYEYSQMQWNFSLFWGLAVQAYEATLVSDDTPFDRFQGAPRKGVAADPSALSESERAGMAIFMDADPDRGGRCNNCHAAPIMTNHSVTDITQPIGSERNTQGRPVEIIEYMVMGDGTMANYDKGFYNIGVRRTSEDLGRALTAPNSPPFLNPMDNNQPFPLSYVALEHLAKDKKLPDDVLRFIQLDPVTLQPVPVLDRQAIHGNFKAPNLRNVQLTGPYFHNGDSATLRQVVEFYTRGGNFPNTNFADLDVDIFGIPGLQFPEFIPSAKKNIENLVNFVSHGLMDERVAMEKAPFDHPELSVPNGSPDGRPEQDRMLPIPAVGKNGRPAPLGTFLNLDPQAAH
jgi:cytochrome c peroxidase